MGTTKLKIGRYFDIYMGVYTYLFPPANSVSICIIIIIGIQPLGRSGQRPELSQGTGTLHPGQVLRGSLPLFSLAF